MSGVAIGAQRENRRRKMCRGRTLLATGFLIVIMAGPISIAELRAEEVSFAGKTVEWIVPFPRGGGTDTWARVYAPYLQRYLPGNPNVVVKNAPGGGLSQIFSRGGNLSTVNRFHERARPDGLTLLGTSGSTLFPYLLGDPRVKYNYQEWHIVLASPEGGIVYVNPTTDMKTVRDLKGFKGELTFATQGTTSLDIVPLLAFEVLGLEIKAVFGYKGRGPARKAFELGETNIDYQTTPAYLKAVVPLLKAGKAISFFSWGQMDHEGNLVRDPAAPDLPHLVETYEMLNGDQPSGPAFDCWKALFVARFAVQKALWLPRGTPAAIVTAYRETTRRILDDPEFQNDLKTKLGGYRQYVGESARQALEKALKVPPESMAWLKEWLKRRFDAEG